MVPHRTFQPLIVGGHLHGLVGQQVRLQKLHTIADHATAAGMFLGYSGMRHVFQLTNDLQLLAFALLTSPVDAFHA